MIFSQNAFRSSIDPRRTFKGLSSFAGASLPSTFIRQRSARSARCLSSVSRLSTLSPMMNEFPATGDRDVKRLNDDPSQILFSTSSAPRTVPFWNHRWLNSPSSSYVLRERTSKTVIEQMIRDTPFCDFLSLGDAII